jgi:ParB-like chromosome segregation protein Spo0J
MTDIVPIPVEDTYPNPRHYREVRPEAVKLLADSIAAAGQLEPIRVWRDGNLYIVDSGHHRLEAVKSLGLSTIDAVICEPDDLAMVGSNLHAIETEIERSRGTQLLLATGVAPETAAAVVGADALTVARAAKGFARVADPVAAEDMSLDRLATIEEFRDDPEVVEMLTNASEKEWRGKLRALITERKPEAVVEQAHYSFTWSHNDLFVIRKRGEDEPVAKQIPTQSQAERICAIYREAGVV